MKSTAVRDDAKCAREFSLGLVVLVLEGRAAKAPTLTCFVPISRTQTYSTARFAHGSAEMYMLLFTR